MKLLLTSVLTVSLMGCVAPQSHFNQQAKQSPYHYKCVKEAKHEASKHFRDQQPANATLGISMVLMEHQLGKKLYRECIASQ